MRSYHHACLWTLSWIKFFGKYSISYNIRLLLLQNTVHGNDIMFAASTIINNKAFLYFSYFNTCSKNSKHSPWREICASPGIRMFIKKSLECCAGFSNVDICSQTQIGEWMVAYCSPLAWANMFFFFFSNLRENVLYLNCINVLSALC